jgi:hypothetical protein
MGVSYRVEPLSREAAARLRSRGLAVPDGRGRNPTPAELRQALAELPGRYTFRLRPGGRPPAGGEWHVDITTRRHPADGPWAWLRVDGYLGENQPVCLGELRGSPRVVLGCLLRLAARTGPLVLACDADEGGGPVVVAAGSDLNQLLAAVDGGGLP